VSSQRRAPAPARGRGRGELSDREGAEAEGLGHRGRSGSAWARVRARPGSPRLECSASPPAPRILPRVTRRSAAILVLVCAVAWGAWIRVATTLADPSFDAHDARGLMRS